MYINIAYIYLIHSNDELLANMVQMDADVFNRQLLKHDQVDNFQDTAYCTYIEYHSIGNNYYYT